MALVISTKANSFLQDMLAVYEEMVSQYPIISIEDGMAEQDKEGWKLITTELGSKVLLVGDDVFVTKPSNIHQG